MPSTRWSTPGWRTQPGYGRRSTNASSASALAEREPLSSSNTTSTGRCSTSRCVSSRRDRESAGTIVGSALAFRLFLFFAPLLLCTVGILGFVASWTEAADVNQAAGVTGSLAVQINSALTQPNSTRWAAMLVGLFGMFWAGRSLSKVMVTASCLAWQLPLTTRAPVRVIGAVVGLFVGIGLVAAIVNRIRLELGLAAASLSFLAAFAVYVLTWIVMSTLLPRATKDPGRCCPAPCSSVQRWPGCRR